ncbi:hypothetical protein PIN31115_03261 [Pandoraea iniqua]|uniref:Uncharacterized protein n=1 Tax=Pandoraea iniqua TaxID=2508288 RepID=A0A5E4WIL7_9BURK|nr:hypothetical protein PIN31115_03261 [Pandoraea iniqua]
MTGKAFMITLIMQLNVAFSIHDKCHIWLIPPQLEKSKDNPSKPLFTNSQTT